MFLHSRLTAECKVPCTGVAGKIQQPQLRLQSAPPQAIYQLNKNQSSRHDLGFYYGIKQTQKSSWSSLRYKDKRPNHAGPDLMALVNTTGC